MILVVDNYDSFTFNLMQILLKKDWPVKVIKNDEWTLEKISSHKDQISAFLISPGPGHPQQATLSQEIVKTFAQTHPILGVCLGHQVMALTFGAQIKRAEKPMHGKRSLVTHTAEGCFRNLRSPLQVVRYHSLIVDPERLPQNFQITAWTQSPTGKQEIMGLRHIHWPLEGLQFHPESVLTEFGEQMVVSFFERVPMKAQQTGKGECSETTHRK